MTILALESTIITHGLPYPQNVEVAKELEAIARSEGCHPKTIGIVAGKVRLGLSEEEIETLAQRKDVLKAGVRELPYVQGLGLWASTTVSATAYLAARAGIQVFATGGIGGVHPGGWDVSQDLWELARSRLIVVSAGPKAILDLPATLEMLETLGVLVVGYQTDRMPAFYTHSSSLPILRVDTSDEIAQIYTCLEESSRETALLVFNPIPEEDQIPEAEVEAWTSAAQQAARLAGVHGKALTPFLLAKMAELSDGQTIRSNRSLAANNVRLGCRILAALAHRS